MGGKVWQRDVNGGKTFSTGIQAAADRQHEQQQQQQRPAFPARKRVWTRESADQASAKPKGAHSLADGHTTEAAPAGAAEKRRRLAKQGRADTEEWDGEVVFEPSPGEDAAAMPGPSGSCAASREQCEQDDKAAAAEKLRAAQAELAALKRKIEGREQRIAREQAEAAARADAEQRRQADLARWKAKLDAGFPQAQRSRQQPEARAAAAPAAADAREVARVLAARDDYEVLRLPVGAAAAALRKRYREMAVALHPDKCRVARATDAFQRLVQAYNSLLKVAA